MPRATRHGPRLVGRLLPPELRRAFRGRGFAEAAILTEWEAVVGERLARLSCPERLGRDGALRVRVTSGAALELQHVAPQVIERIAVFFGHRAVNRLALVQGPVRAASSPKPRGVPRVSAEAEGRVGRAAETIADPDLRAALARLGRAVLATREPD
jgi:hypothetical protein